MASAALVGAVESGALAERVEGWVQYCEYFHLLDADMQVRRPLAPGAGPPPDPRRAAAADPWLWRFAENH